MSTPVVYESVCSGIEAATVAWHPFGFRPAFFAEVESFCCELLKQKYPEVPNYGDFTKIERSEGSSDILVGGTPCQDFSVAGLRAGLDGERGKLTIEFLKLVERRRTRWVVWENVPGVLSADGGLAFAIFLGQLGKLGYGFAYRILDAQHFGVPQRRRRVFVVGYLGDWRPAAAVLFERHCLSGNPAPRRTSGAEVAYALNGRSGGDSAKEQEHTFVAETAWALQERDHKGPDSDTKDGHLIVTPILEAGARTGRIGHEGIDGLGVGEDGDPMFTLQSGKQHAIAFSAQKMTARVAAVRRLTPRECERLQGFPDDYTRIKYRGKIAADGPRYRALGNSMAVPVMKWLGKRIQMVDSLVTRKDVVGLHLEPMPKLIG